MRPIWFQDGNAISVGVPQVALRKMLSIKTSGILSAPYGPWNRFVWRRVEILVEPTSEHSPRMYKEKVGAFILTVARQHNGA